MKLGLGGSKWDPYLQCHEINTRIAQGGWWSHCCSEREEEEREKEREEGRERGEEGGDERGDERGEEEGERGGEEEGEGDGEERGEEEREERGTVKERIDWWLVRGVLRERLLLGT